LTIVLEVSYGYTSTSFDLFITNPRLFNEIHLNPVLGNLFHLYQAQIVITGPVADIESDQIANLIAMS